MGMSTMCMGPLYCIATSGECCEVMLLGGRVFCPDTCNDDIDTRQSNAVAQNDESNGFSLLDIFKVTFVAALFLFSLFFDNETNALTTLFI